MNEPYSNGSRYFFHSNRSDAAVANVSIEQGNDIKYECGLHGCHLPDFNLRFSTEFHNVIYWM